MAERVRHEHAFTRAAWTAALLLTLLPSPAPAEEKDGQMAFNNHCRTCHSTREGDDRLGPSLHGIVGRKAGATEFRYSDALAKAEFAWTEDRLDAFIEDPDSVVTGHRMKPYAGIGDADLRRAIVGFLATK